MLRMFSTRSDSNSACLESNRSGMRSPQIGHRLVSACLTNFPLSSGQSDMKKKIAHLSSSVEEVRRQQEEGSLESLTDNTAHHSRSNHVIVVATR